MIDIFELTPNSEKEFPNVCHQFKSLYLFMNEHGLESKLIEGGELIWINSVKNTLGRINFLVVAKENKNLLGFALGTIKLSPQYIHTKKYGFISYVFVDEEHRRLGVAKKIVNKLETIFNEKKVDEIKLEVLPMSKNAIKFWEQLGYTRQLNLMSKKI